MKDSVLIEAALKVINPRSYSAYAEGGQVAAALETAQGNVYTGICIDTACSLGFCAEHAAAADMLKHNETHIVKMVAVDKDGNILAPCGRCREFLSQLNQKNSEMLVILGKEEQKRLEELLPIDWKR